MTSRRRRAQGVPWSSMRHDPALSLAHVHRSERPDQVQVGSSDDVGPTGSRRQMQCSPLCARTVRHVGGLDYTRFERFTQAAEAVSYYARCGLDTSQKRVAAASATAQSPSGLRRFRLAGTAPMR